MPLGARMSQNRRAGWRGGHSCPPICRRWLLKVASNRCCRKNRSRGRCVSSMGCLVNENRSIQQLLNRPKPSDVMTVVQLRWSARFANHTSNNTMTSKGNCKQLKFTVITAEIQPVRRGASLTFRQDWSPIPVTRRRHACWRSRSMSGGEYISAHGTNPWRDRGNRLSLGG